MKTSRTRDVVICDNPSCHLEVPVEQASQWYQLLQARSTATDDPLDGLDFSSPDCVEEFINLEIKVIQPRALTRNEEGLATFIVGTRR